jgi:hypothetical protein
MPWQTRRRRRRGRSEGRVRLRINRFVPPQEAAAATAARRAAEHRHDGTRYIDAQQTEAIILRRNPQYRRLDAMYFGIGAVNRPGFCTLFYKLLIISTES